MLGRLDVVQIAAHGVFHATRPMQSTLRLHGGEMAIYDLDGVDVVSRVVVLSSCEAGVHRVNTGGEVLGLVAILLDRGAATVIAPIHTVPDLACAEFVADLHRVWATGVTIAEALATVRQRSLERPVIGHWATAAAFTCFGSGRSRFAS
jgi:CHAT domain-containing protein